LAEIFSWLDERKVCRYIFDKSVCYACSAPWLKQTKSCLGGIVQLAGKRSAQEPVLGAHRHVDDGFTVMEEERVVAMCIHETLYESPQRPSVGGNGNVGCNHVI
jgi:hypothetical protein